MGCTDLIGKRVRVARSKGVKGAQPSTHYYWFGTLEDFAPMDGRSGGHRATVKVAGGGHEVFYVGTFETDTYREQTVVTAV
jgi:hypothetical protein